ncbi:MAG TPA: hypothetical protein VED17_07690, partial [Nitrososphaerales archaeon]|nr:hypothetical protein [Nitrososphaerales archaeon]
MSQIAEKQSSLDPTSISKVDLDYLSSGGYVSVMEKADYDQAKAEVNNLEQLNQQLAQEETAGTEAQRMVAEDQKKVDSVFFGLHGKEYKDAARQKLDADKDALTKEVAPISEDEARISEYLQKKSSLDQLVPFGDNYVSLTAAGVIMLNSLNARSSRVSGMEFSDFVQENKTTDTELRGIAQRASQY